MTLVMLSARLDVTGDTSTPRHNNFKMEKEVVNRLVLDVAKVRQRGRLDALLLSTYPTESFQELLSSGKATIGEPVL